MSAALSSLTRKLLFSVALSCFALTLGAAPALAATCNCATPAKHHVVRHARHAASKTTKAATGKTVVRIAQQHLANLGYYAGKIDGVMGAQTKAAIKRFQHDKGLKADGALGSKTNAALSSADNRVQNRVIGRHSIPFPYDNAVIIQGTPNPHFAQPLGPKGQAVSSRYARIDISENGSGPDKRYSVTVDDQPILNAEGQPSVIGISPPFDLGNEDAIIFTTYSPDASGCIYKTHVLALSANGRQLLDINDCTRDYHASVNNGSLYIDFPQADDARAIAATWRVEGFTAERL